MLDEITQPVDLCLPNGTLNPAAVGWTRTPLHRANLHPAPLGPRAATWSRTKRWEYWGIVTPTHVIALTVSSLNYAALHQVWVLDRATSTEIDQLTVVPLARTVQLPETSGVGAVRALTRDLAIAVDPDSGTTRLRAKTPRVRVDLQVDTSSESLGVVVPWSDRQFQYTVKAVALPVTGRLKIDDVEHVVGEDAWAVLDHGRGRWPYSMTWNWGAGSGVVEGVRTGLQLGGKWTDGTGSTENALMLDGRVHFIGDEVTWEYDHEEFMFPWTVTGERVDVRFLPFHERAATTNLGIVSATTSQCFGTWRGWMADDGGTRHSVDGLVGWAEHVHNRW